MIPVLAVAAGAVAQAVTGIGFSLVCAPILIASLGPREGVRTALVLSSILNVALAWTKRRDVLVREGALLAVPALAVTPIVAAAARRVDGRWLAGAAGVLTVLSAATLLGGLRWRRGTAAPAAVAAGAASGAMNVIGSIGGPALALFSVNAGWPPHRARPTLQAVFLASNVVALVALGLPDAGRLPALVGGLAAGSALGLLVAARVPAGAARRATLLVAMAGGAVAAARAAAG